MNRDRSPSAPRGFDSLRYESADAQCAGEVNALDENGRSQAVGRQAAKQRRNATCQDEHNPEGEFVDPGKPQQH